MDHRLFGSRDLIIIVRPLKHGKLQGEGQENVRIGEGGNNNNNNNF
jgi:hypothetical protein